ncbi:Aromatic-ring-hydroxylating dioxygenase alpha subunit [Penicillium macrosclerotiorum]|uniref:Aromatic-ring-hydroxylating dioxygenase alpha subunit n=1 Tax=Penicillium macrosclerotiorum TaxID=303699 RepID=UPI0025491B7B|nr:Aromatic-ring-hydroxylating dioxygenase alpha subunit [Penicillium macrosclerotiorum]KAJ5669355.1 Aromatic-ring-hydroxylating dioxygenase alpha subunit [Penicillium macrosclerotiorum]
MELQNAYFLLSPGSAIVALLTAVFLATQAWPHIFRSKRTFKLTDDCPLTPNERSSSALNVSKEPEVPEGWWSSKEIFELERRGLFSKSWLYLAHSTQFSKSGAYQSFNIAGFSIFLIRGKDNQIRAFHNICRHRAYSITKKETGASTVLGCRYHGWSYDTTGRLVKAPQFDDVPGFDKSENGLFEIHTHVTDFGYVFVNLNAGSCPTLDDSKISALNDFVHAACPGKKSEWVTGKTLSGNFNWKMTTIPNHHTNITTQLEERMSKVTTPSLFTKVVRALSSNSSHASCSLFPATLLYSFADSDFWIALSFLPVSETITQVRYDLFDGSRNLEETKDTLTTALDNVMQDLVRDTENHFLSIFDIDTQISPITRQVVDCLQGHSTLEKKTGGLIFPAMHQPKGSSLFQQAEQLCKEIDCAGSGAPGKLEW